MGYKFVDEAKILARSGNGGAGSVSFRREKHVDKGGPDGGNGGRGGSVIIRADPQMGTLLDYKFQPRHLAANGGGGEGNQKSGKDGDHAVIPVPIGTSVFDLDSGGLIADITKPEDEVIVCKGGRGGKGNAHFKGPVRQTPRFAQPGEPGEEKNLRFELKLLADVGLVGFPNVGKSSLIARISAAKPKIADYPFTTLVPNLGVVQFGDQQHYVVADVPGLIVGAHEGAGLGTRFLRHIERVSRIAHLVTFVPEDDERDPVRDFEAIEAEMVAHNKELGHVPRVLVLNRIDIPDVAEAEERLQEYAREAGVPFFAISAATGAGVDALVNHLGTAVSRSRDPIPAEVGARDA